MAATETSELSQEILGGLACCGIDWRSRGFPAVREALPIYRRILSHGYYHLPFFLILDLCLLAQLGIEAPFRSEFFTDNPDLEKSENLTNLRKIRNRYEREFLGRLLHSPEVQKSIEIIQTSPDAAGYTELLLTQLLRSVGGFYPAIKQFNPAVLRDFSPSLEEAERAVDAVRNEPSAMESWFTQIEQFVSQLSELRWSHLLHEEDLFELTHLGNLKTEHLRVGCRQILEVARQLPAMQPGQLDLSAHEEGADTAFVDETHYPSGGLTGLTNRGSLESLLTSELVYLDERDGPISLFDLRFVEGECLYFMRDSGLLRRKRRTIHFILDAGGSFERKSRGYDWQYSVLIQGLCLRLLHDLFTIFEKDALRFEFDYITTEKTRDFLEGEIALMRTVLGDYLKHDWVRFTVHETLRLPDLVDLSRKSYAVVLASPESVENWRRELEEAMAEELRLFCALVEVDARQVSTGLQLPLGGLSLAQLAELKDRVLEQLLT